MIEDEYKVGLIKGTGSPDEYFLRPIIAIYAPNVLYCPVRKADDESESPMRREPVALTESGKTLGVRSFYTFIKICIHLVTHLCLFNSRAPRDVREHFVPTVPLGKPVYGEEHRNSISMPNYF
jgi:hypothetical protein